MRRFVNTPLGLWYLGIYLLPGRFQLVYGYGVCPRWRDVQAPQKDWKILVGEAQIRETTQLSLLKS
jgi:hypothetical protein